MSTCPRCRSPLTSADYEGVGIETCDRCNGHWLGAQQLRDIIDIREKTWSEEDLNAFRKASVGRVKLDKAREDLPCPTCGNVMEAFNYGGDSGIILDKCRACGGIWLDGGELDKVQMAVESSDQDLDADLKRLSGRLHEVEVQEDALERDDNRRTHAPLIAAIANKFLGPE